jgi:hypothetical protein
MNFRLLGILALLMLPASHLAAAPNQATMVPRVEIEEMRHVFDPVVEGTNVTHAFTVRNAGDAPLVIKNVRTG